LILSIDGERHHRQRKLVAKAFTPRAIARLQALIVEIITELLDPHLAEGCCDVVTDIAEQFPIPIICALLGTPRGDWQLFSDWNTDIKKIFDFNLAADKACIVSAWQALDDYLEDMIARRRRALTDDLISDLIRAEDDGERLNHVELLSLAVALLGAGTDTTRHQLAAALDVFCDYPAQWALLGEHPELAPRAVEEVMRHGPSGSPCPASPPTTSNSPVCSSPPARWCSPTPRPPTATPRPSTTPTASTSPAKRPPEFSPSATAHTTAWAHTSHGSNSPKH
jgi:cytochrome P450